MNAKSAYGRKKGDRVYLLWKHRETGEEKRRYGTVASDEIEFWDYTQVAFDDAPNWSMPILGYYLHDDEEENR